MGKNKRVGLCHRCEWRALNKETGRQPRCECGEDMAVHSCYMFQPVKPLILEKNDNDPRPQFAGFMISGRSHAVGIADFDLDYKDGVLFWTPKEKNETD